MTKTEATMTTLMDIEEIAHPLPIKNIARDEGAPLSETPEDEATSNKPSPPNAKQSPSPYKRSLGNDYPWYTMENNTWKIKLWMAKIEY